MIKWAVSEWATDLDVESGWASEQQRDVGKRVSKWSCERVSGDQVTKWENGQVGVWTSGQVSEMGSEPVGEWASEWANGQMSQWVVSEWSGEHDEQVVEWSNDGRKLWSSKLVLGSPSGLLPIIQHACIWSTCSLAQCCQQSSLYAEPAQNSLFIKGSVNFEVSSNSELDSQFLLLALF